MTKEAVRQLLEEMVKDVLAIHRQNEKGDLPTNDFEFMVDRIIDDYMDRFFEIDTD